MDVQHETVTLAVSDGSWMNAYVARPAAGRASAGMLVFQEGFGVNAHIRDVTERFARQGYLAIAPELFHRTGPGFEGSYTDFGPVMEHIRALTDAGMENDIRAAFDWVALQGGQDGFRVGAVGYCMGGRTAFLAAATVPVACAVSYYGGGIAPNPMTGGLLARAGDIQAPCLFFWGGLDKHITPEQTLAVTQAMREAGKVWTSVEFSFADHGFSCDARASYNAEATKQAWAMTLAFLETHLGG